MERPSEQQTKFSASFYGSRPPKLMFSTTIYQLDFPGLIAAENVNLEDLVWSHFLF